MIQPALTHQSNYVPVVRKLLDATLQDPDLGRALAAAIRQAALPDFGTLVAFLAFLNTTLTRLPDTSGRLVHGGLEFYYLQDQSAELKASPVYQDWCNQYVRAQGEFLDSAASAAYLPPYFANPDYKVEDYSPGPSGWRTFNQFFARQLRAGKRPIAEPGDKSVIVAPTDGTFAGVWSVASGGTITVKGVTLDIGELLQSSKWADVFTNGSYSHTFLRIHDYHRFHSPVAGRVCDVARLPGRVGLDVVRTADGELVAQPGTGFQFVQDRGIVVIEGDEMTVAVVPVGMAQISSVNFSVDQGARVAKGEELGFFQFGGSDVILLTSRKLDYSVSAGSTVVLGQEVGRSLAQAGVEP